MCNVKQKRRQTGSKATKFNKTSLFSWTSVLKDVIIHSSIPSSIHDLSGTLFLHTCIHPNSWRIGTMSSIRSLSETSLSTFPHHTSVERRLMVLTIWMWLKLLMRSQLFYDVYLIDTEQEDLVSRWGAEDKRNLKAGTHWTKGWTSEMFGETWTSSGTNLFGVVSCVGSVWNCVESVWSDSTCNVWECCWS